MVALHVHPVGLHVCHELLGPTSAVGELCFRILQRFAAASAHHKRHACVAREGQSPWSRTCRQYAHGLWLLKRPTMSAGEATRFGGGGTSHFGLALAHYTHFTSPIRRYADLLVHRQLLAAVAQGKFRLVCPPDHCCASAQIPVNSAPPAAGGGRGRWDCPGCLPEGRTSSSLTSFRSTAPCAAKRTCWCTASCWRQWRKVRLPAVSAWTSLLRCSVTFEAAAAKPTMCGLAGIRWLRCLPHTAVLATKGGCTGICACLHHVSKPVRHVPHILPASNVDC